MSEDKFYANGVLSGSGAPALELDPDELYELIKAEVDVPGDHDTNLLAAQKKALDRPTLGLPPIYEAGNLASARWGIIWPPEPLTQEEQAHREALAILIDLRREQMGGAEPFQFHYQQGWDYDHFLYSAGQLEPGDMQPDLVPYYLCIVGSPERIPWEFQQYLDAEYAVGRIWFDDASDCQRYVQHLLAYETAAPPQPAARDVLIAGTRHPNDHPTQASTDGLVKPLYDWLSGRSEQYKAKVSLLTGEEAGREAYKAALVQRLQNHQAGTHPVTPSLLFTAGHGLEFATPSSDQYDKQGALICQEWPGWFNRPQPEHYFAASDVNPDLNLKGMVAFCFACHSAGTPLKQDWVRPTFFRKPKQIAPAPFVAALPQKMLAHGLLAFIGHVSRAWESSFLGAQGGGQMITPFKAAVGGLLTGQCVGHATDTINQRWFHQTVQLEKWISQNDKTKEMVIALWRARNDYRGYVVLGDPVARLKI